MLEDDSMHDFERFSKMTFCQQTVFYIILRLYFSTKPRDQLDREFKTGSLKSHIMHMAYMHPAVHLVSLLPLYNPFKGTVSRDFLYPVFFTNQLLLVLLEMS